MFTVLAVIARRFPDRLCLAEEIGAFDPGNGAGKTTLMKLLLGPYQPTSGTILYDETDIRRMELPILRSQIGVVTQSDQLLTGTVAENIAPFRS